MIFQGGKSGTIDARCNARREAFKHENIMKIEIEVVSVDSTLDYSIGLGDPSMMLSSKAIERPKAQVEIPSIKSFVLFRKLFHLILLQ